MATAAEDALYRAALELAQTSEHPFMLVKHIDEVPEAQLEWPARAEVKYDGVFAAIFVKDSKEERQGKALSRTGRPLYLPGYKPVFRGAPAGLYIAELICPRISLEQLSGMVNPNRKKAWARDQLDAASGFQWVLHDYLTFQEYIGAHSGMPTLVSRLRRGRMLNRSVFWMPFNAMPAAAAVVDNLREFEEFAECCIQEGGEGAVLKQLNSMYVPGHKGYRQTKRVRGVHLDLECVGVELGRVGTKRAGQISRLAFKLPGCDKPFWADLGKGWTDELRGRLTQRHCASKKHPVIGQVFHIKGLQMSSTGKAVRLPKVMEERIDKETQDV